MKASRFANKRQGNRPLGTLTGTLIDKTTAAPIEMDGLPLTSMVAFESLALGGNVVATHEDIEDEGQSVDLVEKPMNWSSALPRGSLKPSQAPSSSHS